MGNNPNVHPEWDGQIHSSNEKEQPTATHCKLMCKMASKATPGTGVYTACFHWHTVQNRRKESLALKEVRTINLGVGDEGVRREARSCLFKVRVVVPQMCSLYKNYQAVPLWFVPFCMYVSHVSKKELTLFEKRLGCLRPVFKQIQDFI